MKEKFEALVKGLDAKALETLSAAIAAEIEGRGGGGFEPAFEIGAIRVGMSATEKEQAQREIARVLREG